jgi:hypothetical protein
MADLICDHTPDAFSTHRDLPPLTVKLLRLQYDDYLWAGDKRRAAQLVRLSASDAAGRVAAGLNRRNRKSGEYLHPTVWAEVWRRPQTRRKLQRMVRDHPQRRLVLASFRMGADERWARPFQLAKLLIQQVELAARPLRPPEVDRLIDDERQSAENYGRCGMGVLACICERRAAQHARDYFRTEAEREDAMIYAAARWLVWHFAMRGDRLVAGLVGEGLGREIFPRRVCYLITGR